MEAHRSHSQGQNSTGTAMCPTSVKRSGRPRQYEAPRRNSSVYLATNRVPNLRKVLPFINKDGAFWQGSEFKIGSQNFPLCRIVEPKNRIGPEHRSLCLTHALRTV